MLKLGRLKIKVRILTFRRVSALNSATLVLLEPLRELAHQCTLIIHSRPLPTAACYREGGARTGGTNKIRDRRHPTGRLPV